MSIDDCLPNSDQPSWCLIQLPTPLELLDLFFSFFIENGMKKHFAVYTFGNSVLFEQEF